MVEIQGDHGARTDVLDLEIQRFDSKPQHTLLRAFNIECIVHVYEPELQFYSCKLG